MNDVACFRRWQRFVDSASGKALIVPMDHGLTMGPLEGICHLDRIASWLDADVATGVVVHKGLVQRLGTIPGMGLMIQLNGALSIDEQPDVKSMLTSVKAAIRLGADAVSVQANFSSHTARHSLRLVGKVVDHAHAFGLPVLCMVYDKSEKPSGEISSLRHFMRAAVELGVDALKIAPPDELDKLPYILEGFNENTPVLIAGGVKGDAGQLLRLARAVVEHNAGGLCMGRNVFQRNNPRAFLASVLDVLRGDMKDHEGELEHRIAAGIPC